VGKPADSTFFRIAGIKARMSEVVPDPAAPPAPQPGKLGRTLETLRGGWPLYRQLIRYMRPYRTRFFLGLLAGLAFAICNNGLLPLVVKNVTSSTLPSSQNSASASTGGFRVGLMSVFSPRQTDANGAKVERVYRTPTAAVWAACLAIPAVMLVRSLFAYLNAYCMHWVSLRVLRDIRQKLFAHLVGQSMDFYSQSRAGQLISRVTNDASVAQFALASVSADLVKQPFSVLIGISTLLYLDWRFTLVCLVLFPICILPVRYFGKRVRRSGARAEQENSTMTILLQETFAGIRVVKAFGREAHQSDQFVQSANEQLRSNLRARVSSEIVGPMVEAVGALGAGLALLYAYTIGMTSDAFFALLGGTFLLYEPVKTLSKMHLLLQQARSATENIFALMSQEATVQDRPDAAELRDGRVPLEFADVDFRYHEEGPLVIHGLNLRIDAGRSYALVGQSGAGKSTIFALLQRFYDPTNGSVKVGGRDLREFTQKSLREQIGVVTQEGFLFHDTVFNNILFGRLDATREDVIEAAKKAYAHEFISALPEGYDTVVGDKGNRLSGGQQQRLAIARALLKNAPILLLDEATSALDTESERMVQQALERLAEGRTVVAIAHRLSTIVNADHIVVMEQGRIVEQGNHAELFTKSGYYRRLYDLQFSAETQPAAAV
jgi:ATP-binding cassette, subfamily B, bacterial MsbA